VSTVLLLVPPDRQITGAIAAALNLAETRGAGLLAVAVVDTGASARLSSRMTDVGLLAEKVTDQLSETLAREHRVRGEALLREICDQAQARGVPCRTAIESGDPAEVCRRLVEGQDVTAAVLVAEKRSWLGRILARGRLFRPEGLGCEVLVVDED
jgi:nucleotide-binding universal stress UspA family protein